MWLGGAPVKSTWASRNGNSVARAAAPVDTKIADTHTQLGGPSKSADVPNASAQAVAPTTRREMEAEEKERILAAMLGL